MAPEKKVDSTPVSRQSVIDKAFGALSNVGQNSPVQTEGEPQGGIEKIPGSSAGESGNGGLPGKNKGITDEDIIFGRIEKPAIEDESLIEAHKNMQRDYTKKSEINKRLKEELDEKLMVVNQKIAELQALQSAINFQGNSPGGRTPVPALPDKDEISRALGLDSLALDDVKTIAQALYQVRQEFGNEIGTIRSMISGVAGSTLKQRYDMLASRNGLEGNPSAERLVLSLLSTYPGITMESAIKEVSSVLSGKNESLQKEAGGNGKDIDGSSGMLPGDFTSIADMFTKNPNIIEEAIKFRRKQLEARPSVPPIPSSSGSSPIPPVGVKKEISFEGLSSRNAVLDRAGSILVENLKREVEQIGL